MYVCLFRVFANPACRTQDPWELMVLHLGELPGGSKDESLPYQQIPTMSVASWGLPGSLNRESLTGSLREPNSPAQGTYNSPQNPT